VIGALVGLGIAIVLVGVRATGVLDGIEWRFVDLRTRAAMGETPPDPRIVIAEVRESDVYELKREEDISWPWPLDVTAYAFWWMADCGVEAVAIDVYHFDRGAGPGELNGTTDTAEEAAHLARAYHKIGKVALAFQMLSGDNVPHREPLRIEALREKLRTFPEITAPPALHRTYPALPVLRLLTAATWPGYANTDADQDGIIRRAAPFARLDFLDPLDASPAGGASARRVSPRLVPSLPAAAALLATQQYGTLGPDRLSIGRRAQRLDARGSFYVNFRGPKDTYRLATPSKMILQGRALEVFREVGEAGYREKFGYPYREPPPDAPHSREALKGKIVVWGVNIAGIKDVLPTPVSDVFPGPEYQATVVDNLLNGDGRVAASFAANAGLLASLCALLGLFGGAVRVRGGFLGSAVVLAVGLWFGATAAFRAGWSIDLFTPAVGIGFTYAGVNGFHLLTEGRRNKWLEGTFGQYLSPAVIEALKENPEMLQLGGRRVEITVSFSDVKGFTTLSEKLPPDKLVPLLNRYLTGQSMQVLAQEGVIDKFIGDAVMAFFGDPVPQGDHAVRACRAAVRCRQVLPAMKPLTDELGVDPIVNRIGINSGPATVGNMGSDARFDYTAMGDTVNLASRLEGANKAFGSWILLGSGTYERAKDAIVAKRLGRIQVVGKKEAVAVYELLDLAEEATPETRAHVEAFERARKALLADDLVATEAALDEAEKARPGDGPTSWMRWLVRDMYDGRLRRPWDEVIVLESK
jgi:adenylate cyclase